MWWRLSLSIVLLFGIAGCDSNEEIVEFPSVYLNYQTKWAGKVVQKVEDSVVVLSEPQIKLNLVALPKRGYEAKGDENLTLLDNVNFKVTTPRLSDSTGQSFVFPDAPSFLQFMFDRGYDLVAKRSADDYTMEYQFVQFEEIVITE